MNAKIGAFTLLAATSLAVTNAHATDNVFVDVANLPQSGVTFSAKGSMIQTSLPPVACPGSIPLWPFGTITFSCQDGPMAPIGLVLGDPAYAHLTVSSGTATFNGMGMMDYQVVYTVVVTEQNMAWSCSGVLPSAADFTGPAFTFNGTNFYGNLSLAGSISGPTFASSFPCTPALASELTARFNTLIGGNMFDVGYSKM